MSNRKQPKNPTTAIPNEGAFLQALGLNPDQIMAGSTRIEWQNGNPVMFYTCRVGVTPLALGMALIQSDPQGMAVAEEAEEEQTESEEEGDGGGED